jgi:glycine betaine/proline transport system substrate-binding protein
LDVKSVLSKAKIYIALFAIVCLVAVLFAGCVSEGANENTTKGKVTIGYVLWDSEIASTNILKQVFEQAGYEVDLTAVDAGPLYQAVADSDVDCTISAWLPTTQAHYWEKYGNDIDQVRYNLNGTKVGLVVPTYVTIDSIAELDSIKDKVDGKITGIEPGAGMMARTEEVIEEYGLDYELMPSSSAGMASALTNAYKNNEWIVVTGWTPHWMFSRFDLKYLEDPKNIYGGDEYIATLARKGLKDDKPDVYAILEKFYWTADDMNSVMMDIEDGMSEEDAAKKWIDANQDTVKAWIGE